jgi:phosphinothricin acetyltransferase
MLDGPYRIGFHERGDSSGISSPCRNAMPRLTARLYTLAMADCAIRAATLDDLPALTSIYNYYVVHTPITFDLQTFTAAERRGWFDEHAASGPHRLLVATAGDGTCVGYATSSRWRPKPAYQTTVEASVYCDPDALGKGYGTALYAVLFAELEREDVHIVVAGVSLPNPASLALHERFGFRSVGVFHAVGRKFDRFWDVAWFERPLRRA